MSRHRQLSLSVIGLGPHWETEYRSALERLGDRGRIAAVAGPTRKATLEAAQALAVPSTLSLRGLVRQACDGVILTDPGWYGWYPVELCIDAGRNVYFPAADDLDPARLRPLQAQADELGLVVVPEFRLRYTPSTLRLRELLVTDLGPIHDIQVEWLPKGANAPRRLLRELLDWCRVIVGGPPQSVQCRDAGGTGSHHRRLVTLQFPAIKGNGQPVTAQLRLPSCESLPAANGAAASPTGADAWPLEFTVRCKHGEARLENAVHLRWREGGQERIESLSTERTAVSVSLDHFARRLAGGLIPVPSLTELQQAESTAARAHESFAHGGTVVECRNHELRG